MVKTLVESLLACPEVTQIIVTRNIPELLEIASSERVVLVDNATPKGFGANHNAAFSHCAAPYFCPLNPDISLQGNPFSELVSAMDSSGSSIVAPLVISPAGLVEDSIRHFPTIGSLASKTFGRADGRYVVQPKDPVFYPEWIAGMFLLFRSADFVRLGGFDEGFFLYYEDVDICARAWKKGMKVLACPSVAVIHDARRDSHRSARHLRWHLASMGRYFWKHWWRLPKPSASR
jgi:GT2 family glycosyltransferase